MNTGSLRHRVTIRRIADVPDGRGGYNRDWTTVAQDVPAEVISENGREALIGNVLQGISNYRITTRFIEGVMPEDQIKYGTKELNILTAADPDGRRQRLEIRANDQTPQGA